MRSVFIFFQSTILTAVILVLFVVCIAAATFIERSYGTDTAMQLVYHAKWFELLLLLGVINIVGVSIKYKLYGRGKRSVFLFHISFIFIIFGAGITRYFSEEGKIHIKEGKLSDSWYTSERYLNINLSEGQSTIKGKYPVLFSGAGKNRFNKKWSIGNKKISVKLKHYLPDAIKTITPFHDGGPVIDILTSDQGKRKSIVLSEGDSFVLNNDLILEFDATKSVYSGNVVKLYSSDSGWVEFVAPFDVVSGSLNSPDTDTLKAGRKYIFSPANLYYFKGQPLLLKDFYSKGIIVAQPTHDDHNSILSAILLDVTVNKQVRNAVVFENMDNTEKPIALHFDSTQISVSLGSDRRILPFQLYLKDFSLKKYPGSNSPSSYESIVQVIDKERSTLFENKISMNNILKYRGYRFYQASYDPDEKGSILFINRDGPGTLITYLGYFLLSLGIFLTLFNKNSRLHELLHHSSSGSYLTKLLCIGFFFIFSFWQLQPVSASAPVIDSRHAKEFGKLLIQDNSGRIKPVNTLSSEVLRKVLHNQKYKNQNSDQVFLGMMVYPMEWRQEPLIRIKLPAVKKILSTNVDFVSFNSFFPGNQYENYVLRDLVENAYKKLPAERSKLDNEIIRIDERVNICYMVYSGMFLKIFPLAEDPEHRWYLYADAGSLFQTDDTLFINHIVIDYFHEISRSIDTHNWKVPDEIIQSLSLFQQKYGREIIPSTEHVYAEILYNEIQIFHRLITIYFIAGLCLLILQLVKIFTSNRYMKVVEPGINSLLILAFISHSIGLGLRWYVSGHAPWSNGYETLVFIAWASVLAGLMLSGKSGISLSASALLAGLTLQTAHLSWMDPQITNLVPVLKSPWLIIHVAVITSSYGFLGIAAILALLNLILMNLQSDANFHVLEPQINRITAINEASLTLGLYLMTLGTFLGAVWANESWGRYWAWDPKETWALITLLVYAFILHTRLIPFLKGTVLFTILTLAGFGSVLMTYFGVNYFFSGLHSYAHDNPVAIPIPVFIVIFIIILITVLAVRKQKIIRNSRV